ncbi:MAG: HAMP domain-containing histidine kinase [Anaerolineae bacterium]|nr:HAMP domain-containing histidine kinase [Anaerolineae bacterium]
MLRTLNARLLFSYIIVILVCLALTGIGIFLFVRTSPLWLQMGIQRLEGAERETMRILLQEGPLGNISRERLHDLLGQAARAEAARILLLDAQGVALFDSGGEWVGVDLAIAQSRPLPVARIQGVFRAPDGRRWLYVGQVLPGAEGRNDILVFAAPPALSMLLVWFAQNLLPAILQAGLVALVLSIFLAWLVTRSISRPLKRVAGAARAIARGDLEQRAPVSGPQEICDLAQAFNHMAGRVADTHQAQRDFIANVSHELKTPLTSVQGFSQAILDGTVEEKEAVRRSAQVIYDEAERMRRMVEALLGLARFDAGQVDIQRAPVDLTALLTRSVERMIPQAEAAGNVLQLAVEEGLIVTGDADWLTQVLVNLLDNAIRHTRNGRIEVAGKRQGKWLEIAVTDTGQGIPAEHIPRVFERFYQADGARRHQGGVGLGLSIVREVIQLHGGTVAVESVVGLGSRFTVRLPLREESGDGKRAG